MKILICIISLCLFSIAKGQSIEQITIGTVHKLYSQVLHEERNIWIYKPSKSNEISNHKYPVLYLLDAEAHYFATVGNVKQMSGIWGDIIVVGLVNTDRNRDLTPAKNGNIDDDKFITFIEKELKPYVAANCPAAPYSIFSGHSLGGLTVVNTLLYKKKLFNAYIALDPS
jgi:uncharacterized protein